jgi:PBP1b-binding outer membrane lipoprotein LpoB
MTKHILSAAAIAAITFSGCSQVSDTVSSAAKGTANMAKSATEKVSSTVTNAVDSNKSAATDKVDTTVNKVDAKVSSMKVDAPESSLKVGDVVETKVEMEKASVAAAATEATTSLPTSTSYTEQATTKVMEVADEKTDGKASQVVDALK